jgi:hypothetical protein
MNMLPESTELPLPPWRSNPEGQPRRIGVELEMSGLTLDELAGITSEFFGTTVATDGRYGRVLKGDAAGDWVVELDFRLLRKLGHTERVPGAFGDDLLQSAEDALHAVAQTMVPVEIVSPPLPMERLPEVEALIARLRAAGAKGTSDHPLNAFGMQFNPEIPRADAATLSAYLRAFLCLYDWLFARADIDLTRRLTSYVDPFPADYVRLVTTADYSPDLPGLIDDYLRYNPTRNRALDLLPLFAHLDGARVAAVTDDPLIKPRPAFHYRLPDCRIDQPGWGLAAAWNDWLQVERLAADPERLAGCCADYHDFMAAPALERWLGDWAEEVAGQWLAP